MLAGIIESLSLTSLNDFKPRFLTFINSSSGVERNFSTLSIPALFKQLYARTLSSNSSMGVYPTNSNLPKLLDVVFSDEPAREYAVVESDTPGRKMTVGTVSWIPAMFGCRMARHIVEKIIAE